MNNLYSVQIVDEDGIEKESFHSMEKVKDFILDRLDEYIEDVGDKAESMKIEITHTTKGK
tara:strand:- start:597 stop:776 length:180 start_codon:yes stop_codon:yes gene_type:complete